MSVFPSLTVKPPKQSNHDLSRKVRTTMAPGVLYPMLVMPVISGDKVKISMESLIKTYPALSPIMGSFKLQADFYFSPLSLYNQRLHHNSDLSIVAPSGTRQLPDEPFPVIYLPNVLNSTYENWSVSPDSLLAYLGFPSGYRDCSANLATQTEASRPYNAIPLLMYYDIVRNYYANRQELNVPVINQLPWSGAKPYSEVALSYLDRLYTSGLTGNIGSSVIASGGGTIKSLLVNTANSRLGGLALRSYLPDFKNVILSNSLASAVGNAASISTTGNSFTVDQFNLASKLYKVYTLSQLAGNRFSEWLRAQYAVKPDIRVDMPTFIGSTSTDVVFEDVVATADTGVSGGVGGVLGSLAGRGRGYADGKSHYFVADQPGYIMCMVSLIPRVDYFQSIERYLLDVQLSDLFVNNLNGLGLQDVLMADINAVSSVTSTWSSSTNPFTVSYGKQPAWIHLMTAVNRLFGDFTESSLRGWTLSRVFDANGATPSSYIQPDLYNYAFADTSILAENFLAQFAFTIFKRSNVSKRMQPTI